MNGFDQGTASPIAAAAQAAYARNPIAEIAAGQFRVNGGVRFAGDGSRAIYDTPAATFSPRFGFAWTPAALGTKTVVRGGVGIYYFTYGVIGTNQPGFSQNTPVVPSNDGFRTIFATLSNPFPQGILQPTGASQGVGTFLGRAVAFFNPVVNAPYSARWTLSIQRELSKNTVLELGYMANKAIGLQVDHNQNGVPLQYLSNSPVRDQPAIDRMTANVANPFAGLIPGTGLTGSTVTRNQLLRPYPHFTNVVAQQRNDGSSHFHAFQARLERRFANGFQMIANYQWSKLMEKRSRLNDFDPFLEKRIAGEDRPQRLVVSGSYDLPFGKGQKFLSNSNVLARQLAGGWTLNWILTLQPGAPLGWGNVIYLGGPLNLTPHKVDNSFDVTRFVRAPAQQLEWNRRTFPTRFANLRSDGVRQIDFSAIKAFNLTEKAEITYRCEFFNGTNRPIFSAPNLGVTAANFGQITNQANQPRRIQMALRIVF